MHHPHLGCQTITWGDRQHEQFPQVFAEAAAAGFAGVEIGFRRLGSTSAEDLRRMLDAAGLTLLGSHIGGNLEDASQAADERNTVDRVLDYLERLGTVRLMYSGLKYESDPQFERELDAMRQVNERCVRRGIKLLYHNHDWEFLDGGRIIEALIERTEVGFCPDIGWMFKGGCDVTVMLDRMGSRIGALHFKDFGTPQPGAIDTVLLGDGVAPLAQVAQWAIDCLPDVWMIAEQDQTGQPAAEAMRRNGQYMRRIFNVRSCSHKEIEECR